MCCSSARGKISTAAVCQEPRGLLRHFLSETNLVRFAVILCNMSFMAETFFWEEFGSWTRKMSFPGGGGRILPCFVLDRRL